MTNNTTRNDNHKNINNDVLFHFSIENLSDVQNKRKCSGKNTRNVKDCCYNSNQSRVKKEVKIPLLEDCSTS